MRSKEAMAEASAVRSRRGSPGLAGLGLAAAPLVICVMLVDPALNRLYYVPSEHFYVVSAISLLAALLAVALAVAVVQIALYRILLLALGFFAMGGLFAVHGLTTPGILVPSLFTTYRGSAVALSAFLSLTVPGIFFATSYLPGFSRLERRMPFWPAGGAVALVVIGVVAFAATAILRTQVIAALPLSSPPVSWLLASLGGLLLLYAGFRQWRSMRVARLGTQAALAAAFVLLAEAQAAMVLFRAYSAGWWLYHLLMLVAVVIALRALLIELARGRSLRSVWEATLELEVSVGVEEIDMDAVAALVAAVEVKDQETLGHNRRVAQLAVAIGRELGMRAAELRLLARSGLLHDVGKLGIPDAILRKPGRLTPEEWDVIKTHPQLGTEILNRTGRFKRELLAVLYHHERMDGSGYPHGLVGDAIPIEARIIAVADTYDVLISDRPYRSALDTESALRILGQESGAHLDSSVVDALADWLRGSRRLSPGLGLKG